MRNDDLIVEVPAKLLNNLLALVGGYTMSGGRFISRQCIKDGYDILWDSGYEDFQDAITGLGVYFD